MKRLTALVMAICMLLCGMAVAEEQDSYLLRAVAYGLLTEDLAARADEPITYRELCTMLHGEVLRYAGEEKAAAFAELCGTGMELDAPMTREAGMVALCYAGRALDVHENGAKPWELLCQGKFIPEPPGEFHGAFPKVWEPVGDWPHAALAATVYCSQVKSKVTQADILEFDYDNNSFHAQEPMTFAAAARGTMVLLENYSPTLKLPDQRMGTAQATQIPAELDAKLHQDLQDRIDSILNSETEIVKSDVYIPGETYTGTAYYVSPNGNDSNDGLTPETAWQTLAKVREAINPNFGWFKYGDAVFFERGGMWRIPSEAEHLHISSSGVTFSAYGEGPKPLFTSSWEDGASPEKWQLIYSDDTGMKIWQFYKDMPDTGKLFFNGGESTTTRVCEVYTGSEYVSCIPTDEISKDEGATYAAIITLDELKPLSESLTTDLSIISRPVLPNVGELSEEFVIYGYYGPLYLRCDAGNPGSVFDSIEFVSYIMPPFYIAADDVVMDNLCLKYVPGFMMAGPDEGSVANWPRRSIVQNCEFAYASAVVHSYVPNCDYVMEQCDGLYGFLDVTIRNNYFHDLAGSVETYEAQYLEWSERLPYEHIVTGNAIVNTVGLRLDSTSPSLKYFKSLIIEDNMIFNTGACDTPYFFSEGALPLWPNEYETHILRNNVFYGTHKGSDGNGLMGQDWFALPDVIEGNIWVQYAGKTFMYYSGVYSDHWQIDYTTSEAFCEATGAVGDQVYVK